MRSSPEKFRGTTAAWERFEAAAAEEEEDDDDRVDDDAT